MNKRRAAIGLVLLCILTGCTSGVDTSESTNTPAGTSIQSYCTESQQKFLEQAQETLPVKLIFHDWSETTADYPTTDAEIISKIIRELKEVTVAAKSSVISTDNQGLAFITKDGDTCTFWFDEGRFQGADGLCYVLSGDGKLWKLVREIQEADSEYQNLTR